MKSTLKMKLYLVCLFILGINGIVFSQVPPDPTAGPPEVPITGIEILIGAGAIIGARKLVRLRNKK